MRRIAFPLTLAATFAVAALGAHAMSTTPTTQVVEVSTTETPDPTETPDATETPEATETPSASETSDAPDDSDGRGDDDNSGPGKGDDDSEDRSGSNSGPG